MKYLWEVALEAQKENVPLKSLRFTHSSNSSAYMELALPFLNQMGFIDEVEIEVNTYFRFYSIFKNMFTPDQNEFSCLRESLTNLILHVLMENDVRRGMTKDEYYKKMLILDIRNGVVGETAKRIFPILKKEEQEILLSGWLRTYQVKNSLAIFIDMIHGLIDDSIVYHNNDCPNQILIYTALKKTVETEDKIVCLVDLFLDIEYQLEIFYEYHFGIIGIDNTMIIDEIAMY